MGPQKPSGSALSGHPLFASSAAWGGGPAPARVVPDPADGTEKINADVQKLIRAEVHEELQRLRGLAASGRAFVATTAAVAGAHNQLQPLIVSDALAY